MSASSTERVSVREVLGVREFRALLTASTLSVLGDQVARIAVAVLVYERTDSAFFAAATIACSYLTWLVGGPFLSALADRWPRRKLMIGCDLLRALLVALLVLPDVPLRLLFGVLLLVGLLAPPFDSAKSSVLPEVLEGERYVVGNSCQGSVLQAASLTGFLVGGALVASVSPQGALAVDALTFLASALLIRVYVQPHAQPHRQQASITKEALEGLRLVARNRWLHRPLAFGVLGAIVMIVPEGLAVPIATELGGGPRLAGVLIASVPVGFVLGSVVLLRITGPVRQGLVGPLTALACLPLLASPVIEHSPTLVAIWTLAGCGSAVQLIANAQFMSRAPIGTRGRAFGVAALALNATSGLALIAAGGLAEWLSPRSVVAVAAATTLVLLVPLLLSGEPIADGRGSDERLLQRARTSRWVSLERAFQDMTNPPARAGRDWLAAPSRPPVTSPALTMIAVRSANQGRSDLPDLPRPRAAVGEQRSLLAGAQGPPSTGRKSAG